MRLGKGNVGRSWFLLLMAFGGMGSVPVNAEDLAQVYLLSKDSDPKYRAGRFEFEAIGYAEPQAMAALLPTISLEASQTDTRQRIVNSANARFFLLALSLFSRCFPLSLLAFVFGSLCFSFDTTRSIVAAASPPLLAARTHS